MNKQGVRRLSSGNGIYRKVIVGVDCQLCGTFVAGKGHKKFCPECQLKWNRCVPRCVAEELNEYGSSGRPLPFDLMVWARIIGLRSHGIYNICKA